jgi:hypothetical protein
MKWIGRILYVVIVGVVTYFMITVALAARTSAFLEDSRDEIKKSDTFLLSTLTVTTYNGASEAYILREPIFQQDFSVAGDTPEVEYLYRVNIKVYTLAVFNKKSNVNCFAIILKDIIISDEKAVKDSDGIYQLSAKFTFSDEVKIDENKTSTVANVTVSPIYDSSSGIILINESSLKGPDGNSVSINKIDFYYKTEAAEESFLSLYQTTPDYSFTGKDQFGTIDATRLYDFSGDALKLNKTHPSAVSNDLIYYNPDSINGLKSKNIVIVRYMSIFVAIVIVITYLIFFHKTVWALVKAKINSKKEKKEIEHNKNKDIQRHDIVDDPADDTTNKTNKKSK